MTRLLVSTAAAALLSSASFAADLPVYTPPIETEPVSVGYNWTGFYVGIQGGYGWATGNHTDTAGTTSGDYDIDGWLAGGTIGAQWQTGMFVLGVEGDIAWADINGNVAPGCLPPTGCSTQIDIFATARGRVGVAFDRFMPYITGGAAFADMTVGQPGFGATDWVFGWTGGGGFEFGFTDNLSAKAEALYVGLEDLGYVVAIPVNVTTDDFVIVRGGINWRF